MTTTTARERVNLLAGLLARERDAQAEFLSELADFDDGRCWEELGYPSLFEFLVRELRVSRGNAFYRTKAVGLIRSFPEVLDAIRQGRLCITIIPEVARVLTPENRNVVLPRFFGLSREDAKLLSAELAPREVVPVREVATVLGFGRAVPATPTLEAAIVPESAAPPVVHPLNDFDPKALHPTGQCAALIAPVAVPKESAQPMTGQLSRLHLTVTRALLAKVEAAQLALSHARPGATMADLLELGADTALAQDAKRKGLVKNPRPHRPAPPPASSDHIPAEIRRAVWKRDGGCCQWKMANGEICGSRYRPQFDHIQPKALGGETTVANVRILCQRHNLLAARQLLGDELMRAYRRAGASPPSSVQARSLALTYPEGPERSPNSG